MRRSKQVQMTRFLQTVAASQSEAVDQAVGLWMAY